MGYLNGAVTLLGGGMDYMKYKSPRG